MLYKTLLARPRISGSWTSHRGDCQSKSVLWDVGFLGFRFTHGPLSSSFLGLPYRILNIDHKKELLREGLGSSMVLRV